MKCNEFRDKLAEMDDSRQVKMRDKLPSEMTDHLEACRDCSEYFFEMENLQRLLMGMGREKIPSGLSLKLARLAEENSRYASPLSARAVSTRLIRVTIAAVLVWVAAALLAPGILQPVEVIILLSAMVPMFEKMGRSLISDNV